MTNDNANEVSIKEIGKKVYKITLQKKRVFYSLLIAIMVVSSILFIKFALFPNYNAESIIVSKKVSLKQLTKTVDLYNNYIDKPELTLIDDSVKNIIDQLDIKKVEIVEFKNNSVETKEDNYNLYNFVLTFRKLADLKKINQYNAILIHNMQSINASDVRILQDKLRYQNGISELDSVIDVANHAGRSYTNKIQSSSGGQLMVMNDVYSGINNLISLKLNYQKELNLLETPNLIFQTSPVIVNRTIVYPWMIFVIGIGIWIVLCILWTLGVMVFGESE